MTSDNTTSIDSRVPLGFEKMTSKKLKKHQVQIKCLGGQLSLQQSVKLIVFIEVFFSLVMITQSIDLLTKNGNHFYFLHNFVGYGVHFFVLHVTVCSLCLLTSSLLLLGISKKSRWLLVPHLLWQISYASLSFLLCLILPRLSWRGKIMPPSCIVITTLIAISGGLVLWWSYVVCRLFVAYSPDEPHDFTSVAFPAYRQVPVTEKIAQDLCGEGTGTRNSTAPSTHHSSTDL